MSDQDDLYIPPPDVPGYVEEDAGPGKTIEEVVNADDGRQFTRRRKRVTLVMLSGGVDSAYALAKVLRESDDLVIAHHVHLVNREGRHRLEAEACANIVEYCRSHYREFKYTESLVNRQKFRAFGIDVITAAFEAGIVVQSYFADTGVLIDRWTVGINAEDVADFDPDDTASHRTPAMLKAFEANCHPHAPPQFFSLPLKPKRDLVAYLGPELAAMCWTCRRPVMDSDGNAVECGQCHTCKIMQTVREAA